ncbi:MULTISPECIES: glycosyltransferase [Protofrankia]|uniref:Glycosyl transferase family 2 n=1 Tax=Candidatus Protofrankia datiscae TaxID=2716812 RepID=F8AYS9_9ACTN|nr:MULTISPECIES: glycosyltransferase [Protofrankia]AEH08586.1 hypothetical protein FsymDg_1084 [Candidatus Protofrankia datiscae]
MTATGPSPPSAERPVADTGDPGSLASGPAVGGQAVDGYGRVEVVAIVVAADQGRGRAGRERSDHAAPDAATGPGLARTLRALGQQTRRPDHVVVVDVSGGPAARRARIPDSPQVLIRTMPPGTGYGAAVAAALASRTGQANRPDRTGQATGTPDFLWLLRHDSVPALDTLERLLTYAALDPSAAVLGPKVLDWADPKLIVEAGATVDSAGRRVTGIGPGEIDAGQHDAVRDVLAVSDAGALVRGPAWRRLGGFDPRLRAAAGLDFCWRVWRAGMRVVVVPPAVIHAARPGGHRVPARGQRPGGRAGHRGQDSHRGHGSYRDLRREELRVRMANISAGPLVPAWLGLVPAALVRGAALAAVGQPRQGLDEVAAAATVMGRPGWLWRARRRRAVSARVPARRLRTLLAARGGPLGAVRTFLRTFAALIPRAPARRRGRGGPPVWAQRPALALAGALAVVSLIAARFMLGPGWGPGTAACRIPGTGVSLPLPDGARDLWSVALAGWPGGAAGAVSAGSVVSGPTDTGLWLLPLAVLATVLGGRPWLAADIVLLGGPALAALAAYAACGHLGPARTVPARTGSAHTASGRAVAGRAVPGDGVPSGGAVQAVSGGGASGAGGPRPPRTPVRVIVAAGYALSPPMSWAVAAARVDVVFALVLLPGLLTAAAALVTQPGTGRATWPTARRLALRLLAVVACAPALLLSAVVGLTGAVVLLRRPHRPHRLAQVLAVAVAGSLPWWPWRDLLPGWRRLVGAAVEVPGALPGTGAGGRDVTGAMADALPDWLGAAMSAAGPPAGLSGGHVAGLAAVLVPVALAGAAGAVRAETRGPALAAWGVVAVGLAGAAVESYLGVAGRAGEPAAAQLAVAVTGMLAACALSVTGVRGMLRRHRPGWRHVTALSLGGAVAASPFTGALMVADAGQVAAGAAARTGGMVVSALAAAQLSGPDARVLILRQPARDAPIGYTLTDARGPRLDITFGAMSAAGGAAVGVVVADLVTGRATAAGGLTALAVGAVVVPAAGAAPSLVAALDAVPGLVREQVADDAVVWRRLPAGPAGSPR